MPFTFFLVFTILDLILYDPLVTGVENSSNDTHICTRTMKQQ